MTNKTEEYNICEKIRNREATGWLILEAMLLAQDDIQKIAKYSGETEAVVDLYRTEFFRVTGVAKVKLMDIVSGLDEQYERMIKDLAIRYGSDIVIWLLTGEETAELDRKKIMLGVLYEMFFSKNTAKDTLAIYTTIKNDKAQEQHDAARDQMLKIIQEAYEEKNDCKQD